MAITKNLFEAEVTRKEFLTYIAMSMLALFGVRDFLSFITGHKPGQSTEHTGSEDANRGFGSSKFGV